MEDWTKRFALAALLSFVAFFFALPVSCAGFLVYNEHLRGDVQSAGPEAILKAFGAASVVTLLVFVTVWRRTRPQQPAPRP